MLYNSKRTLRINFIWEASNSDPEFFICYYCALIINIETCHPYSTFISVVEKEKIFALLSDVGIEFPFNNVLYSHFITYLKNISFYI